MSSFVDHLEVMQLVSIGVLALVLAILYVSLWMDEVKRRRRSRRLELDGFDVLEDVADAIHEVAE